MTKRNCTTTPTFAPYPEGCMPSGLSVFHLATDLYSVLQHDGVGLSGLPEDVRLELNDRLHEYRYQLECIRRLIDVATYRLDCTFPTKTFLSVIQK